MSGTYDGNGEVDLRDPSGYSPGHPRYNWIGAQVRHIYDTTGLPVQHNPRRNALVVGRDMVPLSSVKAGREARDKFFTALALAIGAVSVETASP